MKLSSLNKGLVGHWPLDEQSFNPATKRFTNKTPNENHGTSANAPVFTTDRMGQADRAMSFDGSSDYVDCGNDESLDITNAITVSMWAKLDSLSTARLVAKWDGSDTWILETTGTEYKFWIDTIGGVENTATSVSYETDVWHQIIGSYDGTDIKIYVDRILQNTHTHSSPGNITQNSHDLYIGVDESILGKYFNGSIADVRVYNRALSETEIGMLYENYRSKVII